MYTLWYTRVWASLCTLWYTRVCASQLPFVGGNLWEESLLASLTCLPVCVYSVYGRMWHFSPVGRGPEAPSSRKTLSPPLGDKEGILVGREPPGYGGEGGRLPGIPYPGTMVAILSGIYTPVHHPGYTSRTSGRLSYAADHGGRAGNRR